MPRATAQFLARSWAGNVSLLYDGLGKLFGPSRPRFRLGNAEPGFNRYNFNLISDGAMYDFVTVTRAGRPSEA